MPSAQDLIRLAIAVSLSGMVTAIGLKSTPQGLLTLFRAPRRLLRAVVAVDIIVPLAAMALTAMLPLAGPVKAGILGMAVSPAPPLLPRSALKAGAEEMDGYALYTTLVVLGVVTVPATVSLLAWTYGIDIALPPLSVLKRFSVEALAPLGAGLVVHRLAPRPAEWLGDVINRLSMLVLLIAVAALLYVVWPQIQVLLGNGTVLAMTVLSLIALAGGHLLGGPEPSRRGALAMAAAMRHPGIALMILAAANASRQASAAVLLMLLVGMITTNLYRLWLSRRARREATPA